MAEGQSGNVLNFYKYQAAGDNFIVVDNTKKEYPFITDNTPAITRVLDRAYGVGGNALLELLPCEGHDYEMVYYNANGVREGLCGNGSLCVAAFVTQKGIVSKKDICYKAADGPHKIKIIDEKDGVFTVEMQLMKSGPRFDIISDTDYFMKVGKTPHFFRFVKNLDNFPLMSEGPKVVKRKEFQDEEGAYANFLELDEASDGSLCVKLRIYYREVKGEILACGTASTGATLICYHRSQKRKNG